MQFLLFILSFLFVFGIVVFIHELGHFVVAKVSKVKVLEFGFGFPPAIFKKKVGETTYSINAIPFGGFVKMLGESGEEKNDPRSFASQTKLVKAKIISAGVFMNFVLAWVVLSFLYAVGFMPLVPGMENHYGAANHIYIDKVDENTPAYEAGIKKNDEIIALSGKEITYLEDFRNGIRNKAGESVEIKIKRGKQIEALNMIPYKDTILDQEITRIGITVSEIVRADNIFIAPITGFSEMWRLLFLTIVGLIEFFGGLFLSFSVSENVVGPVGLAVITNEVRKLGFTFLLQFLAILSLSLALLNIMPIPALDGGHLFVMLIEKVRGKDMNQVLKNTITIIGFTFLIAIMFIVTARDIIRFSVIDSVKNFFGL